MGKTKKKKKHHLQHHQTGGRALPHLASLQTNLPLEQHYAIPLVEHHLYLTIIQQSSFILLGDRSF